jgi:uncharacterized phage-associated protein
MYDARVIADYVIAYYEKADWCISNLKLQKVLYFLQAEYLVSTGNKLFDDEIEAWGIGPVIPSVYREYKIFGGASIPAFNKKMPWIAYDDCKIINPMLDHLKDLSSTYLTQVTIHQRPWIRNYSSYETRIIPVNEIREYFMED